MRHKKALFWPLALTLVLADCATKQLAVERLSPAYVPHSVVGEVVRFTLAYNPGAAFSFHVGPYSRWVFSALAVGTLVVLGMAYWRAPVTDTRRVLALALVAGGALGNLLDRLRSPQGVVDFIDLGVGDVRFYTFNLADVGVSVGAALLAVVLWQDEAEAERRAAGGS